MTAGKGVVILVPSLKGGGAERVAVNLANEFAEQGVDVTLLVVTRHGVYWNLVNDSVRLVRLDRRFAVLGIWSIWATIRQLKPAVVLSTLKSTNVVISALRSWLPNSIRVVIREANIYQPPSNLAGRVYERLQKLFYRRADTFIANSADTLASFRATGIRLPSSCVVLPNPVTGPELKKRAEVEVHHDWLGQHDGMVTVSIGRLVEQKGFDVLLDALKILSCKGENVCSIILGSGGMHESLVAQAERNGVSSKVDFVGFVDNPYAYLAKADAFVLPSRWEGFGNVIVEALALDVPVIASDCPGGPAEILAQGKWGTLVPPEDAEALAAAIQGPLIAPPEVSLAARAADFGITAVATKYLQAIGVVAEPNDV